MPPDDPLGRNGPKLDRFLRKSRPDGTSAPTCPYGKKCTYGNKCKYYHPERGNVPQKTITERLAEQAQRQLLEVKARGSCGRKATNSLQAKALSLPLKSAASPKKTPLSRTQSIAPTLTLPAELIEQCPLPPEEFHASHRPPPPPPQASFSTPPPICMEPSVGDEPNPHRKVQRQLTLNPVCDSRLYYLTPPYPPPPIPVHSLVTRNASAPVTQQIHPQSASRPTHMQRLNSTSDTQLNLYGSTLSASLQSLGDPFDEWSHPPPPPQRIQPLGHSWASRTSSLPAGQQHQPAGFSMTPAPLVDGNNAETRYKTYFHLAAIFPEEQVRRVMALMPEETNAQSICAAILALYPKDPHSQLQFNA